MQDINTVADVDTEIERLKKLRGQLVEGEKARLREEIKKEIENFKEVSKSYFEAWKWTDESRQTTSPGGFNVVEIETENNHFFIVFELDRDDSISTTEYAGPISFSQVFSRTRKQS